MSTWFFVFTVSDQGPANVTAVALSSTSIKVMWAEVPAIHQNGIIRGYKVKKKDSTQFNSSSTRIIVHNI